MGLALLLGCAALAAPVPLRRSIEGDPLSAFRIRTPTGTEQGPRWLDDYEQGLNIAAAQNSILMVLFVREDCEFSRRLRTETLSDPRVWDRLRRFALVEVDSERRPELAFQYRLRSTPTLLWVDAEGRELQRATGFVPVDDLLAVIQRLFTPGAVRLPPEQARLIQELKATPNDRARMIEVLEALPRREGGANLRAALRELKPAPYALWRELLAHERLAIRLGALELLEESAGNAFGLDPWKPNENEAALAAWGDWIAKTPVVETRFAPLSRDQLLAAVRDLSSDSAEHVQRATRAIETGGPALRPHIEELLAGDTIDENQRRRLNEIRLSLGVAALGWADAPGIAYRLRRGPLDARMHLLREIARQGPAAIPVLAAFLEDPEILIRETVIEGLLQAGRDKALPVVLLRLREEPNPDIALAAMRALSKIANADATAWIGTQLNSGEEERVLGALGAMQAGKHDKLKPDAIALLDDTRWRIRAEAAETLRALGANEALPVLLQKTNDPDTFARSSILNAVLGLSNNSKQKNDLIVAWLKDSPRDFSLIVRVACGNNLPLPDELLTHALAQPKPAILDFIAVLGDCQQGRVPVAVKLAAHSDADVSAAALRLLAATGLRSNKRAEVKQSEDLLAQAFRDSPDELRVILANHLNLPNQTRGNDPFERLRRAAVMPVIPAGESEELDELFGAFVDAPAPAVTPVEENTLDDLMDAFAEPKAATPSTSNASLKSVLLSLLSETENLDLRRSIARALLASGDESGLDTLLADPAALAEKDLERVFSSLRGGSAGLKLAESLIKDSRPAVRRMSVAWLAQHEPLTQFLPILDRLDTAESTLTFQDIPLGRYEATYAVGELKSLQLRPFIQKWLSDTEVLTPTRRARQTLALFLLMKTRDTALSDTLRAYAEAATDPDLRAAAWTAMAVLMRNLPPGDLQRLSKDSATAVRQIPAFLFLRGEHKSFTLKPNASETWPLDSDDVSNRWNFRPGEEDFALLETQRADTMPEVRFLAGLALFTHNKDLGDPEAWKRDFPSPAVETELSELFQSVITEKANSLGGMDTALVEWLTASHGGELPEHIARRFKSKTRPVTASTLPPSAGEDTTLAERKEPLVLIYFHSTGCEECEVVAAYLDTYRSRYPDLRVRIVEISDDGAIDLYRSIYRQSGRPLTEVGLTPMLAGAGGNDAGGEALTFDRIGDIIAASIGSLGESWIPVQVLDSSAPPLVEEPLAVAPAAPEAPAPPPAHAPPLQPFLNLPTALVLAFILLLTFGKKLRLRKTKTTDLSERIQPSKGKSTR